MGSTRQGTKYTREILLDAVAASHSFHDVLRHLGTPVTGSAAAHIARRIRHFDIDVGHFTSIRADPGQVPELSRPTLAAALNSARSMSALARTLNLPVTPRTRRFLREQLLEHGLDPNRLADRSARVEPEFLRVCAAASTSLAGMMRLLGTEPTSTGYRRLRRALDLHEIDTSHFQADPVAYGGSAACASVRPAQGADTARCGVRPRDEKSAPASPRRPRSRGGVRDVRRRHRVARPEAESGDRPRQRRLLGQPAGEPAIPLSQLPCDHAELLPTETVEPVVTSCARGGTRTRTSSRTPAPKAGVAAVTPLARTAIVPGRRSGHFVI